MRSRLPLALFALALLPGAECLDLESLVGDQLDLPDPCESPEIACNGVDENCDGVDDCAEVPPEAVEALRWALGFVELDCAGIDGLRTGLAALDAGLPRDAACPGVEVEQDAGPVWDGVEDCGAAGEGADACSRSGGSSRETLSGDCSAGGLEVTGSRAVGQGELVIELVREGERTDTEVRGTQLLADGWSFGEPGAISAYSGEAGWTRRTTTTYTGPEAEPSALVSWSRVDGCSLDLELAVAGPAPLDAETASLALGGQGSESRSDLESPRSWELSTQGNLEGRPGGIPAAASFVLTRQGVETPGEEPVCSQEGQVTVEAPADAGGVLWRLVLDLDRPCEPCGSLRLDGEPAGAFCAGERRLP